MKTSTHLKKSFLVIASLAWFQFANSQANTSLSNLVAPTKVNVDLLAGTDNSISLGSSTKSWKNIYVGGSVFLDGLKFIDNGGTANTIIGATGNTANTGTSNCFTGYQSGKTNSTGSTNTAIGAQSLFSNTTGSNNTATGTSALYSNTTASSNTAFGKEALFSNTTGYSNTSSGYRALYANTTGYENTGYGVGSLRFNTTGYQNTGYGTWSLFANQTGNQNTAVGSYSLYNNTTGLQNTANGYFALYSNTAGDYNTALGYQAMYSSSNSAYNTAVGWQAMFSDISSDDNTAIGHLAMFSNTYGFANTATGNSALMSNDTGRFNTADGGSALFYNTSGSYNVAVGNAALYSNDAGSNNTAIGYSSMFGSDFGSNNSALGYYANSNAYGLSNSTALGANSFCTSSNQVRVGNSSVTSIGGYVPWSVISDGRYKKNIKENVPGLEFINMLRPVTYHLDIEGIDKFLHPGGMKNADGKIIQETAEEKAAEQQKEQITYTGFVAQEVEASAKQIGYDFNGVDAPENAHDLYGLRYAEFVVPLVKAVQELSKSNEELKAENEQIREEVGKLKKMITDESLVDGTLKLNQEASSDNTLLGQNIPNPASNTTLIPFRIPKNCSDASIVITETASGKILRAFTIGSGETQVSFDVSSLAPGSYSYSLYINGKLIDTKQMILTR